MVGIGTVAHDTVGLAESRASADRALRVLRAGGARRVARLEDVHTEALVLELPDLVAARSDKPSGPVARLFGYDREHGTNLVATLRAWLDAFGDVIAAAAACAALPRSAAST